MVPVYAQRFTEAVASGLPQHIHLQCEEHCAKPGCHKFTLVRTSRGKTKRWHLSAAESKGELEKLIFYYSGIGQFL